MPSNINCFSALILPELDTTQSFLGKTEIHVEFSFSSNHFVDTTLPLLSTIHSCLLIDHFVFSCSVVLKRLSNVNKHNIRHSTGLYTNLWLVCHHNLTNYDRQLMLQCSTIDHIDNNNIIMTLCTWKFRGFINPKANGNSTKCLLRHYQHNEIARGRATIALKTRDG